MEWWHVEFRHVKKKKIPINTLYNLHNGICGNRNKPLKSFFHFSFDLKN